MISRENSILLFLFLLLFVPRAFSQDISTEGTDFWVSFMGNGYKAHFPYYVLTQVMISSKRACSGTITNPNTGWTKDFEVDANATTLIDIPEEQAYNEASTYETIGNKGLMIVASDTVSVYCTNIAYDSFDASYVLPLQALADDYIIQTYDQSTNGDYSDYLTSAFLVVATEDNTTIDITPSTNTLTGSPSGNPITITLNKGQTYQVRSNRQNGSNRDLSGSRVISREGKPIAVFNGNTLTTIPNVSHGFDHIFEQAMPIRSWGKQFIVTQSYSRKRDFVKIVSSADNNVIKKNGSVITTLNSCEVYSFEINQNEKSCYIETSEPSGIYLYNTTSSDDGGNNKTGDPSMLWVAPIEQKMTDVTFTTFSGTEELSSYISNHYVNIIVESDAINNVCLDNNPLPSSSFERVTGNPDFSFTRKEISHDVHHISCPSGFNAHIYGFGYARGYAYMVGSRAANITEEQFIHDTLPDSGCDSYEWHDSTYYTSGPYTDTVTEGPIHYIHHLDLELTYTPTPIISCSTPNAVVFGDTIAVVTNTEFFSFQYDFYVEDSLGHIDDWESCKWHISKSSWSIDTTIVGDPDKHYCRVYVAERCDEYVELSCTIYNHCVEDSITRIIYLKPSFLDIDEQNVVQSTFSVVPNPNNSEMDLHLDHLTGKITIKVYDMKGILIDAIETYNYINNNILHYNLTPTSSGIYFFVATAKEGTIVKKVIIE